MGGGGVAQMGDDGAARIQVWRAPGDGFDGGGAADRDVGGAGEGAGVGVRDAPEAPARIEVAAPRAATDEHPGQVGDAALVDAPLRLLGGEAAPGEAPHLLGERAVEGLVEGVAEAGPEHTLVRRSGGGGGSPETGGEGAGAEAQQAPGPETEGRAWPHGIGQVASLQTDAAVAGAGLQLPAEEAPEVGQHFGGGAGVQAVGAKVERVGAMAEAAGEAPQGRGALQEEDLPGRSNRGRDVGQAVGGSEAGGAPADDRRQVGGAVPRAPGRRGQGHSAPFRDRSGNDRGQAPKVRV